MKICMKNNKNEYIEENLIEYLDEDIKINVNVNQYKCSCKYSYKCAFLGSSNFSSKCSSKFSLNY